MTAGRRTAAAAAEAHSHTFSPSSRRLLWIAGLALQYGADQVEALRRAPPPVAPLLGGRAAVAAILQVQRRAQAAWAS
jgi:hypothetical protein